MRVVGEILRRRPAVTAAVLVALLALIGTNIYGRLERSAAARRGPPPVPVTVARVARQDVPIVLAHAGPAEMTAVTGVGYGGDLVVLRSSGAGRRVGIHVLAPTDALATAAAPETRAFPSVRSRNSVVSGQPVTVSTARTSRKRQRPKIHFIAAPLRRFPSMT